MASRPTPCPDAGDALLIRTADGAAPCASNASPACPLVLPDACDALERAGQSRRAPAVDLGAMLRRIREEFLEMPGLCLTEPQVQRLWALDCRTCSALLTVLVDAKLLTRTADGRVMRPDSLV
jgi:hypothetical protein